MFVFPEKRKPASIAISLVFFLSNHVQLYTRIHCHFPHNMVSEYCKGSYYLEIGLMNQISYNDKPNAELIMESRKNADLVIRSVDLSS